jgi:hypothetical protein
MNIFFNQITKTQKIAGWYKVHILGATNGRGEGGGVRNCEEQLELRMCV